MVTAEIAVAMPTMALVLCLGLGGVEVAVAQVRCVDAAGVAVRLAARGEPSATVTERVAAVAPGATVTISRVDGLVTVVVRRRVTLPVAGRWLPGWSLEETAVGLDESVARVGTAP